MAEVELPTRLHSDESKQSQRIFRAKQQCNSLHQKYLVRSVRKMMTAGDETTLQANLDRFRFRHCGPRLIAVRH